ncbi:MAG: replication protein, partial [Oscillospiraceae bacterium]|nr:replication protein [Oscillospiraceae bacterium]
YFRSIRTALCGYTVFGTLSGWYENTDNPTPFIKYLLSVILAAYRELDEQLELVSDKLSASEVVRRTVERKIEKFTKADIMELCPTLGKTSVESSLKQLVDKGVLIKHGKGRATFYTRV